MALESFLKSDLSPQKSIDNYPKDSVKKMAVLFTDIVGSSNFFKVHGDIAGRKMLQLHQDMASPLISEFGGALVKVLGDSLMAYFLNPKEAVKSAIKIQQGFQDYNNPKERQEQIHLRIFIHFGDGIVEERDIFGDVVNMAAKLLPLVQGDQIFISQEVYKQIEGMSYINFVPVEVTHKLEVINGLTIFKVIWDETISFEPDMKTLLYLKPVLNLGMRGFNEIWRGLIRNKRNLWPDKGVILLERLLPDKSVALILKEVRFSLDYAKNVLKYLKLNMGRSGSDFIPVQIIIDSGPYLRAGRLNLDDLRVNWQEIQPGEIYISTAVHKNLKTGNPSINLSIDESSSQSFFKVIHGDQVVSNSSRFMYQKALIQGQNLPCFYCGNRRHPTSNCPSKHLTELTHFTDKLGYLPVNEINNLFFKYLNEASSDMDKGIGPEKWIKGKSSTSWAFHGFHELKSVYQLRFFRTVWDLGEENWNHIKEVIDTQNRGGLLWIGLDCIRVSNFSQAESIITDTLSKKPTDYKIFCMAGFLKIEKNDLLQAQVYLKKALELAKTTPQKILIFFLLYRIYSLNPDEHLSAKKMLRSILRLNPFCPEALYQDILYKFQYGDRDVAISQLLKLIKSNRDYYIITLIDPDISDYTEEIHPRLERLLFETRQEADKIVPEADKELKRLEKLMGKDSKEFKEVSSMSSKIDEFLKTGSYFGYLDVLHFGESVINMSRRVIEGRKIKLFKKMADLRKGVNRCLHRIDQLPYSFMTRSISQAVNRLQKKVDQEGDNIESQDSNEFQESLKRLDALSEEFDKIILRLKRIEGVSQVAGFTMAFLKKNIFFQSANLIIGLVVFPILTHYLNFILPQSHMIPDNVWYYQKNLIILGAISGVVLASLTTKIKHFK